MDINSYKPPEKIPEALWANLKHDTRSYLIAMDIHFLDGVPRGLELVLDGNVETDETIREELEKVLKSFDPKT